MGKFDKEKKAVLKCALWLSEHGYFGCIRGSGGNISIKAGRANIIVITPSGLPYQQMSADDICVVDFGLKSIEGRLAPSVEAAMHIAIYEHRPDVNAVIHTHSIFAGILSVIKESIPPLFDEIALEIGPRVEVIPYAISGSRVLAENVVGRLGNNCFCYILQNHGALSLGIDLERAWKNAELLEKIAQVYYYALATGREITTLPREAIEQINKMRRSMQ